MRNVALFITGVIMIIVAFIILIVGLVAKSSNSAMIDLIDTTAKLCPDKKSFDNARDGDLIFVSGNYETNNTSAFDSNFNMKFRDPIIKRSVERYLKTGLFTRLLNLETEKKEEEIISKNYENHDKSNNHENEHLRLRCILKC
jgi:hypothetical protein